MRPRWTVWGPRRALRALWSTGYGLGALLLGCGGLDGTGRTNPARPPAVLDQALSDTPGDVSDLLDDVRSNDVRSRRPASEEGAWIDSCPEPFPVWEPADTRGPAGETVLRCLERIGSATDDRIPLDQVYELTTFGGPGDEQPTNCEAAPDADGTWYYAANRQRFGCGARFRLTNAERSRCVVVEVADLGPNICVEEAGGRPAWDVSPLAARHLFGVPRAGWSEHRRVYAARVADETPLGPCDAELSLPAPRGAIGSQCFDASSCRSASAVCLRSGEGWPGGYCTQACTDSCPTQRGADPSTMCAAMPDGVGRCLARCDFTLFEAGCRDGYVCRVAPNAGGGAPQPVCAPLPVSCGP